MTLRCNMDKNEIYTKARRQLLIKKTEKERIARANLDKALENQEFKELYAKEKELIFLIAKAKVDSKSTKALEKELAETQNKISKNLSQQNMTYESLRPNYDCPLCEDSGIMKNGKYCRCLSNIVKQIIIGESSKNVQDLHSFDEFWGEKIKDNKQQTQLSTLKSFLTSWGENQKDNTKLVYICGKTGVGKTFITECAARFLIEKGYLISMISAFTMNKLFLEYHTAKIENKNQIMENFLDPDVLIIDDLGTEPTLKNVTNEYLYLIISERMAQNKKTIISSNLMPNDVLARYGERIFSRVFNKRECKAFNIVGDDLRINK